MMIIPTIHLVEILYLVKNKTKKPQKNSTIFTDFSCRPYQNISRMYQGDGVIM